MSLALPLYCYASANFYPDRGSALLLSSGILGCFVLWNLGMIYQWGAHLVPVRGPISFREAAYNQFYEVPRQLSGHLRSYVFRRSDLMRQIEQRDIEQLKKDSP